MIKKLINLSPMNLKGLKHYVDYVPDVNHSQNINVNHFIETIGKAMEKNRKIEVDEPLLQQLIRRLNQWLPKTNQFHPQNQLKTRE